MSPDAGAAGGAGSPPDAELVRQAQGGDAAAYALLVERYQERAVRLAYSLVHHWDDARDLSQEAFVKAYRRMGTFRAEAAFSTWFYRIVVNTCHDFQRRARWRQWLSLDTAPDAEGEMTPPELPSDAAGPDQRAADRELEAALTAAIDRLPPRQRTVFVLRHLQGLSIDEIAATAGCASGTVKAHLFHATAKLQVSLRRFAVTAEPPESSP